MIVRAKRIRTTKSFILGLVSLLSILSSPVFAVVNPFKQVALSDFVDNQILMTHHVYIPDIAADQSKPRLTIYTNGLAVLSYPTFMKKSGDYNYWLNKQELSDLSNAALAGSGKNSNQVSLVNTGTPQSDGSILMTVSTAEKYDIIRHRLNPSQTQFVTQIVLKQHDLGASQNRKLVDMLNTLATTAYLSNQE